MRGRGRTLTTGHPRAAARFRSIDHDRHPAWLWFITAGGVGASLLAVAGLPPIDLHGPAHYLGIMGPTCGMTRAVRYVALGEFATATRFNPAVWLLPVLAVLVIGRALYGRATGRWLEVSIRWRSVAIGLPVAVVVVLLTLRQQANVDLIGP